MDNLFNILFPPTCKFCKKFGYIVCPKCLTKAVKLTQQFCLVCGKESFSGFTHETCMDKLTPYRLFSLFSYEGVIQEGIKYSKYGLYEFSILKKFTEYGLHDTLSDIEVLADSLFVPVPVSKQKLEKRGFNQAELIAQVIASHFKNTKVANILLRSVDTPTQHDLDRKARFENIKNAFSLKRGCESLVKGKNLTLVDDIVTSGATLLECAKVLYEKEALTVACLTLSRKLLD